jgi:hypothetical protein
MVFQPKNKKTMNLYKIHFENEIKENLKQYILEKFLNENPRLIQPIYKAGSQFVKKIFQPNNTQKLHKIRTLQQQYQSEQNFFIEKLKKKEISREQYAKEIEKLNLKYGMDVNNSKNLINAENALRNKILQNKNITLVQNSPQKDILRFPTQLKNKINISGGAGLNNKGVFDLGNGYVAKAGTGWTDPGIQNLKFMNTVKSPRVMKTVQVKSFRDLKGNETVYLVQQKAIGKSMEKMTKEEIKAIPSNHIKNFENDLQELYSKKIQLDPKRSNFIYDPQKGIQFVDLLGINSSVMTPESVMRNVLRRTN